MEMTAELTKNPNILVAKKDTKEKLKETYIKYFAKTKDEDFVRKVLKTGVTLYQAGLTIAFGIFLPETLPVVGLGTKIQKEIIMKGYDGVKYVTDKIAGVEPDITPTEGIELSEDEVEILKESSADFISELKSRKK